MRIEAVIHQLIYLRKMFCLVVSIELIASYEKEYTCYE